MPEKRTIMRARKIKRAGRAASTQAGVFVREAIRKMRRGAPGARSSRQAVAIGLAEARRAGIALPPAKRGKVKVRAGKSVARAYSAGPSKRTTRRRPRVARAVSRAIEREPTRTASRRSMSRHAARPASRRTAAERSAAARKAARTKGFAGRSAAARKAARTRARNRRAAARG